MERSGRLHEDGGEPEEGGEKFVSSSILFS